MVFSNLIFLYLFLPLCLAAYFLCRSVPAKNAVLIVFSLIFYAWGEPVYLFLMIAAAAVNWGFGLLIEKRHKRVFLVLALVLDLGCLAVFKYTGFVVENLNALFGASIPVPVIALPIGISFYTFQALSYTVDVWRGDVPAQRSFAKFLLYISLFPQLIAGPIVRYADVAGQIDARSFDAADAFYGATRFCIGLAKKVLLADAAGKVAAQILDGSAASATTAAAWLGIVLYTFEIYFDFSGYSDMAIGMGRIFGFKYPENFRLPYTSRSITEFWRRWHISLSSFFRDYVYIPLGGKKKHQLLNMAAVWAVARRELEFRALGPVFLRDPGRGKDHRGKAPAAHPHDPAPRGDDAAGDPRVEHLLLYGPDAAAAALRAAVRAARGGIFQRADRHSAGQQPAAAARLRDRRDVGAAEPRQSLRRCVRAGRQAQRADRLRLCDVRV